MNTRMVIEIDCNGAVQSMCQENILDLGFLGKQSIHRASELVFDAQTQLWNIEVAEDDHRGFYPALAEARGFPTYEDARSTEVAWFTECRAQGVKPMSEQGRDILAGIRPAVCPDCGQPLE